jgi:chemotaxis protein CheC
MLNHLQRDALGELVNIGFGRAALALSNLVSQRVLLEAPDINLYPVDEMDQALTPLAEQEVVNVHQVFRGKISGDAMLLMDAPSAAVLADILSGGEGKPHPINADDREALIETGNILLNAFIGSFGSLLKVHVTFTVPHFQLKSLSELMNTLSGDKQVEVALVVRIHFRVAQGDINGYVIIIMGIASLEALFMAMKAEGYLQ